MTVTAQNGDLHWNEEKQVWEDKQGNYGFYHKRVCPKCNKPRLDINNVCDVDFCLQGLTTSDFIDNACCGHGNSETAYISLKDGRIFRLWEEYSPE